jgi:hypothetical protein
MMEISTFGGDVCAEKNSPNLESEISEHGQVIFCTSARSGEIIPDDQTIGSRQEGQGL